MFEAEPLSYQQARPSEELSREAVEASESLYKACMKLAEGNTLLGLALISVALQFQTGEFGSDVAEFNRRVEDLLAEAREGQIPH